MDADSSALPVDHPASITPDPLTRTDLQLAEPPSASSGTSGSNDLLAVEGGAGEHADSSALPVTRVIQLR